MRSQSKTTWTGFIQAGWRHERQSHTTKHFRKWCGKVQAKLLGTEVLVGLRKIDLPGIDSSVANQMAATALSVIQQGRLGYALITAEKAR